MYAIENYSAIKKYEIMPFAFAATWMYLEIQTKLSLTEKGKNDMI